MSPTPAQPPSASIEAIELPAAMARGPVALAVAQHRHVSGGDALDQITPRLAELAGRG